MLTNLQIKQFGQFGKFSRGRIAYFIPLQVTEKKESKILSFSVTKKFKEDINIMINKTRLQTFAFLLFSYLQWNKISNPTSGKFSQL